VIYYLLMVKNIWVNGCYDILHLGHLKLFNYAKSLGDKLIVGIDSDERVKFLKGQDRPFNSQENRLEFLQNIKCIDEIYIYNSEKNLENLIETSNIDTIVVGEEYKNKKIIGSNFSKNINFFPNFNNLSTSKILKYDSRRA